MSRDPDPLSEARAEAGGGSLLALLFGLRDRVRPRAYALAGFALLAVKYLGDNAVLGAAGAGSITPLQYLSPFLAMRMRGTAPLPDWATAALVLWALPFVWVGVSMTVRRAADAGWTAWLGLLFFVPVVNFLVMLGLCVAPSKKAQTWVERYTEPVLDRHLESALLGVAAGVGIALAMVLSAVFVLRTYAAALFFATPCVMGAAGAYIHNRGHRRTVRETLLVAGLSVFIAGGALLLFALEGVLCLAMAFPIALGMAAVGALVGMAIATHDAAPPAHLALVVASLPLLAGAEASLVEAPLCEVMSAIEIDAPPEVVWRHVIGFAELPEPERWFFDLGIAYPKRAVIEGEGVGAIRRCEFSTGPFIEPITRWEPPSRLSFDVASQPPSMEEWSPYRHLRTPHLEGYLRSRRGEFRLTALPGGRTRLEGSTWYEIDIWPQGYWRVWSDALLHAIHGRVLAHVKRLSEASARREDP